MTLLVYLSRTSVETIYYPNYSLTTLGTDSVQIELHIISAFNILYIIIS